MASYETAVRQYFDPRPSQELQVTSSHRNDCSTPAPASVTRLEHWTVSATQLTWRTISENALADATVARLCITPSTRVCAASSLRRYRASDLTRPLHCQISSC